MDDSGALLHIQELAGPSSEDKPTEGLANGSLHMETDTGALSVYDEDDGWNPLSGGGSSLPPVSASDNGKVLCVGPSGWEAATIDNVDRQIWIRSTIGNDGGISTTSTVSYEALGQLNGGFTLTANIVDAYGSSLATVYLSKKELTDAAFVFEGTYFDIFALKQKSFIVAIPIPSPGSSANVAIAWKEDKFIVTLTPTALDFSGTMDKTVAEITAAYEAGMEIWFRMSDGTGLTYDAPCDEVITYTSETYPSFCAKVLVNGLSAIVFMQTGTTNDGTQTTYGTDIYSLTPAS